MNNQRYAVFNKLMMMMMMMDADASITRPQAFRTSADGCATQAYM